MPYVSRMDYAAGMFYEAIVVNAPERLANVPVLTPGYIRVLMLESTASPTTCSGLAPSWRTWAPRHRSSTSSASGR